MEKSEGKEGIAEGMRHEIRQTETENVSGGGPGPGRLLCTVEPDRRRIGLEMLIRLAASAFALALAVSQETGTELLAVTAAALAVAVLWPLRHWRDGMELHDGGIVYRGAFYPVGPQSKVVWAGARIGFLPSTFLQLSGCPRRIDVSFMKDAEKLFARAYGNVII